MARGSKLMMAATLVIPLVAAIQPSASRAAPAEADEIPHATSWLGETMLPEDAAQYDPSDPITTSQKRRVVQTRVEAVWVDPQIADGKIYTNSFFDEHPREMGVYQYDPSRPVGTDRGAIRPITSLHRQGRGGTAVTGDDKYFYADFTRLKLVNGKWVDDGQVLVRFLRGASYPDGSIAMSEFEGGEPVAMVPDGRGVQAKAGRSLSGVPGGVTAGADLVFVTRPEENAVYVYEREFMRQIAKHEMRNPGAVAYRRSTNSLFVLADDAAGNRVVQEWTVQPSGAMTPRATITDTGGEPVALAANGTRLLIADNAPGARQIRIYADCIVCPQKHLLIDKLGQPGGVIGGGGGYADDRFGNLVGVGIDGSGNIYVGATGRGLAGGVDIRRFSPGKALEGKLLNYVFRDPVIPDPRNPAEVYSGYHKFTLDYSRTTPGQEWSPNKTQLIFDPVSCQHDGRFPISGTDTVPVGQALAVRYLTGSDGVERKYLFLKALGGPSSRLGVYRFDARGVARPSILFTAGAQLWPDGTPTGVGNNSWVDVDADCRIDEGEKVRREGAVQFVTGATSVDQKGTLWSPGVYAKQLYSFDMAQWAANKAGTLYNLPDAPMDMIQHVHYVDATDTLYMYGYRGEAPSPTASPRYILARYDNFRDATKRHLAWHVDMQYVRCWDPTYRYDHCLPFSLAVAGNRVYVADAASIRGRVRVFSADAGHYQGSLYAGPEVTGRTGWLDVNATGITAVELPCGEHIVFRAELWLSRVLMYRYKPA